MLSHSGTRKIAAAATPQSPNLNVLRQCYNVQHAHKLNKRSNYVEAIDELTIQIRINFIIQFIDNEKLFAAHWFTTHAAKQIMQTRKMSTTTKSFTWRVRLCGRERVHLLDGLQEVYVSEPCGPDGTLPQWIHTKSIANGIDCLHYLCLSSSVSCFLESLTNSQRTTHRNYCLRTSYWRVVQYHFEN